MISRANTGSVGIRTPQRNPFMLARWMIYMGHVDAPVCQFLVVERATLVGLARVGYLLQRIWSSNLSTAQPEKKIGTR